MRTRAAVPVALGLLWMFVVTPRVASAATPSNGRIAYQIYDSLYTSAADGSDVVKLGGGRNPVWSPDGSIIAWDVRKGGAIYAGDARGISTTKLFDAGNKQAWFPSWSPTGKRIACVLEGGFSGPYDSEIVSVNPKTGAWTNLTNNSATDWDPAWSPDGDRIAFSSNRDGGKAIYILHLSTGALDGPVPYPDGDSSVLRWSPDGTYLIWVDRGIGIYTYDTETPGAPPAFVPGTGGTDLAASWSPDGERILFASYRTGNQELFSMATDGSDVQQITATSDQETNPAWQPLFVGLSVDATTIDFGGSISLTAHLYPYATTTNQSLSIYRSVAGSVFKLYDSAAVDAGGDVALSLSPGRTTTYIADWTGDATTPAALSGPVKVRVRAFLEAHLRRFYDTSGEYRLYHAGDRPRYAITLLPFQWGRPVQVNLDLKKHQGWISIAHDFFATKKDGSLVVVLVGLDKGSRYRVLASFKGNRSNLGVTTPLDYLKITA